MAATFLTHAMYHIIAAATKMIELRDSVNAVLCPMLATRSEHRRFVASGHHTLYVGHYSDTEFICFTYENYGKYAGGGILCLCLEARVRGHLTKN